MPRKRGICTTLALSLAAAMALSGCMMKPKETAALDKKLQQAGQPYQKPFEQRQLPDLPQPATWQDVLQRAFLANGDLEASYHEWRAGMERISMNSYWPNSNVSLGFQYTFSPGNMKTWDRIGGSAGFDQAMPLRNPDKVAKGGQVAYANALQAAETFRATKFRIQKQVLSAYLDLALMEEQIRIEQQNLDLLKMIHENARSRVQTGGAQQDLLKAQVALRMSENSLASMQSQAATMRAMLNGMMSRPAAAPLVLPPTLPESRPVTATDDQLIAMGVDASPEIARLAAQVKGRKDAIDLAKMQYIPDISPTFGFTGSLSQSVGAMVTLPTTIPMINASIREAKAMRDSSDAMLRQTRADKTSQFVATLYSFRNTERQEAFFRGTILPASRQVLATARQDYASGKIGLIEVVDAQRTLLQVRQSIAQFHIDREKRLADLEELAGVDVEVLSHPTTYPTTHPTMSPAMPLQAEGGMRHGQM